MAISNDEYMYRMQDALHRKEREMEEKMRYMEQMQQYQQGFGPQEKQAVAAPKKPAFQNPKLLLTKGS